jgi:hypothetical protein
MAVEVENVCESSFEGVFLVGVFPLLMMLSGLFPDLDVKA